MLIYKKIDNPEKKSYICDVILRTLPNWFGVEDSIVDYVNKTQSMPFWAAFDGECPIGFVSIKEHNSYTSEICVMGVLKEYHRRGIGRNLIEFCEIHCVDHQVEYLTVKTLDESRESSSYAKTRRFYLSMGFRPLEVFPLHWDKDNPCLFMAKYIPKSD